MTNFINHRITRVMLKRVQSVDMTCEEQNRRKIKAADPSDRTVAGIRQLCR